MIYFDERYLTILWDGEIGAVRVEWKEFIDGPSFRAGLDAGLSLLEMRKTGKWLADLRRLGPVTMEDQRWTNEDWFPRAIAAGLRHLALVSPRKVVAQMSVRTIMSKVNERNLTMAYFEEIEAARDWLRDAR
ncbi:MAG: STAS/SEC14 domain-containing protein [Polyangiaceae bacterium]|nr:STAS/SEC14 domain-containing protein [Polyangiaceae bacterium]NUQ75171.1 STAS/SEC14 domain-containing protein [Polyangiaceae bacterium]